ncbi:hypothetical protein [Octadecabacter ascidiaceicola]|uniref:Uncharacterized protein n=1 Tax=Octadecabacter ascidiaceicola TaxID=1655543 RepID=A0A238KPW5_9RHOB|nr:hypothetical protein [Octadecabacter ascidiaceicola]SMX44835.1 hypothetical protein OCA8868_03235 [Octadecabacter ascidiaceicola]
MSSIKNQRAALTQAKQNEDAMPLVLLEVFGLGGFVGWQSGEWLVGLVVGVTFLVLLSIPYIRVFAALIVSLLWAVLAGALGIDLFELSESSAVVVGILAFVISLSAHFGFITWSKDIDAKDQDPSGSPAERKEEKECPDCAEWIKKKALKCRFCGHDFRTST